jgi:hypothetical protein
MFVSQDTPDPGLSPCERDAAVPVSDPEKWFTVP